MGVKNPNWALTGPPKMPLEPLYGSPKFLSGRFWPISIQKPDLGPDLVKFYPDAGFGSFFFARYRPGGYGLGDLVER